ncbi:hypothetical protein ACLMJK_001857 [Lecanora helva]
MSHMDTVIISEQAFPASKRILDIPSANNLAMSPSVRGCLHTNALQWLPKAALLQLGPEIESWFGVEDGTDPAADNDWSFLPFMALSDGAHASSEDFSYFTLRRRATASTAPTSVFGISCTRQMDSSQLLIRPEDVTRSTVQKAVVVVTDSPQLFGHLREKLSMVTGAWFAQRYIRKLGSERIVLILFFHRDFTDVEILKVGE